METSYPNLKDGRKVVTVAGTRERLTSISTVCKKVEITADVLNTDYITVGGDTVIATQATRSGIPLVAGQTITIYIEDLYNIWIDSVVSGELVTYNYYF